MGPLARAAALAILLLCLGAAPASALDFVVNTTSDAVDATPGNGVCDTAGFTPASSCTLRAAIIEANSTSAPDKITVPAGVYSLTIAASGASEPNGQDGDLDITNPVTIQGAGARTTTIDQNAIDRVLQVQSNTPGVTIQGVTLTGGGPSAGNGAGLLNGGTQTQLVESAVRSNQGASVTAGAGIANDGSITVDRSLITNNQTPSTQGGGGIYNNGGTLTLVNSTISGNKANNGAALFDANTAPNSTIQYSTITQNTSTDPGAAALHRATTGGSAQIRDSIVAINSGTGGNCSGASVFKSGGHNIESGNSCGFTNAAGADRQNADPVLAPLAYTSDQDQTESHGPLAGSPAIDAGNSVGCPGTDQRGLTRPSGATCDIGAVEVQQAPPPPPPKPAALLFDPPSANRTPGDANTVTATVLNDNGSPAAGQSVRFAIAGPNEGAGAVTTGADGKAAISWEGVHEGTDQLTAYVDTNGNLTPDLGEPTGQASVVWALPAPKQARTVNLDPVSGRVRITVKGGNGKVAAAGATSLLTEARQVPIATVVDVRKGRVRMTSVANSKGGVQQGEFYGGVYTTLQSRTSSRPVTEMRLTESLACTSSTQRGKLTASRARSRRLWGNAKGRYRTRGRNSTATVRGTIWLQKDSCNSTTTVVRRGTVVVRDFAKHKNVTVKAGRRYTARRR